MDDQPTISTHVLDTEQGRPAEGIEVALFRVTQTAGDELVGQAVTDGDGRIRRLLDGTLARGDYRIEFALDAVFFRRATLTFSVTDPTRSYHVPLLLAPYAISSYRGS